jgi:N-acetylneuraminate synthase
MLSSGQTFIIAEAGVNHNGSLEKALALIDVAAKAGADAVKFQTFRSEALVSSAAPKADYQKSATGSAESQLEMLRKLELSPQDHFRLRDHCKKRGIRFLSTPFDMESANFLVNELHIDQIKIPSGEITNIPFLLHIAQLGLPVILSTGMSTLDEVKFALGALAFGYLKSSDAPSKKVLLDIFASEAARGIIAKKVMLLHCTSEYPAPFDEVNLKAMDTLEKTFNLPVGLSDHSMGISIAIAAVARGACIIEKHFTLDRSLPGPDHAASLEPAELTAMVDGIRQVELALGNGEKVPSKAEMGNRVAARRSLVAAKPVSAGELWTVENLTCKRPGNGVPPIQFWDYIGKPASRDYKADELL